MVGDGDFQSYRETWHSYDYIKSRWGRMMRVVGIQRAAHFNYQDLVILSKDTRWDELQPRIL
ncbi:MAG: hypothetical protein WDN49_02825 [Acetobacteraceae bacterium]